jgi:predicted O-methyltransferase YrrM
MSTRTFTLSDELYRYLLDVSIRESELMRRLREETAKDEMGRMQISPEQGQFMALLVRLMNAKKALEIGVFTGYSSLCVAQALPPDGKLIACDVNEEWTSIARRYWKEAGVAHKIDLRLAPALETLEKLKQQGAAGTFNFVFIDADKSNYITYYDHALELLHPGGLIAVDNTLWSGRVADPANKEKDTEAIRAFNRMVKDDPRVEISLVPIGDGLTLAMKKG